MFNCVISVSLKFCLFGLFFMVATTRVCFVKVATEFAGVELVNRPDDVHNAN